jgi:hypothetical protein
MQFSTARLAIDTTLAQGGVSTTVMVDVSMASLMTLAVTCKVLTWWHFLLSTLMLFALVQ